MRESQAIVERVRRVGTAWQHLYLALEDSGLEQIKPGQSLLARVGETWDPYLRENWIPIHFDDEQGLLTVEHSIKKAYAPGDVVNIIGPIGSAFPIRTGLNHLLLVAQDYPPTRLLFLMSQVLAAGKSVTLVLTGSAQHYPMTELPQDVEVILSNDPNNWPEQQQTLLWADQVFLIANAMFWERYYVPIFYAVNKARPALPENFLQGVFDFPLPCGTGACAACTVRCLDGDTLTCVQGPAFDLKTVKLL